MSTAKQTKTTQSVAKKVTAPARTTGGGTSATKKVSGLSAAKKSDLPDSSFAFPKKRKEPLIDAKHVRNAIARFDQVKDVTDADRDRAWRRIKSAAKKFGVDVSESSWHELGTNNVRDDD
jgi:hypothetical protein